MPDSRVRRIDPPRRVEVLHDGRWVPADQDGWIRWDDGWRASVTYTVEKPWGRGRHVRSVLADEVRFLGPEEGSSVRAPSVHEAENTETL